MKKVKNTVVPTPPVEEMTDNTKRLHEMTTKVKEAVDAYAVPGAHLMHIGVNIGEDHQFVFAAGEMNVALLAQGTMNFLQAVLNFASNSSREFAEEILADLRMRVLFDLSLPEEEDTGFRLAANAKSAVRDEGKQ